MKHLHLWILILLLTSNLALGQAIVDPRIQEAQALENDKKFSAAFELYQKVHHDAPENNVITFKLAGLAYSRGDFASSAKYYALLAPNGNPTVLYNMACSLSMAGEERKALEALEDAVQKGFNQLSVMKKDPDLAAIRDTKKFAQILKSVKSLENDPRSRAFDFWVGEWNVFNPQNTRMGESHIEKILGDAVILENWSGASGYRGKSFNHFLMDSGKWIQYWVDQNAGRIYFEGNYNDTLRAMVFYAKDLDSKGGPQRKLTFFNLSPDSVRQFSQLSSDEGKTWIVEYDFMYVRKP